MLLKNLIDSCPKSLGRILVKGLSSDTRSIKKGDLFFALKGRKFNGEKYSKIALKKVHVQLFQTSLIKKFQDH